MAKWGLLAVPVVFAVGVLVAWATRISIRDPGADPRSVSEAIAWAKGQPVPRIFPRSVRTRAGEWARGRQSVPVVPAPGTAEPAGRTGVCFSGGGIRSAAYNLGALQELQASGELQRADYLAAVSGGSYIAGAHAITGSCSPEEALGTQPPYAPGLGRGAVPAQPHDVPVPEPVGCGRGPVAARARAGREHRVRRPDPVHRGPSLRVGDGVAVRGPSWSSAAGTTQVVPCSSAAANDTEAIRNVTFDTIPWALPLVLVLLALAIGFGLFDLLLRPREYAAPFLEVWSIRLLALAILSWLFLLGLPWVAARLLSDVTPTVTSRGSAPQRLTGFAALSTLGTGLLALFRVSGPKGAAPGRVGRRRVGPLEEGGLGRPQGR